MCSVANLELWRERGALEASGDEATRRKCSIKPAAGVVQGERKYLEGIKGIGLPSDRLGLIEILAVGWLGFGWAVAEVMGGGLRLKQV